MIPCVPQATTSNNLIDGGLKLSSLLALAFTNRSRSGHDKRLVVVVVLEVDLVHRLRHHDGNVVVSPL